MMLETKATPATATEVIVLVGLGILIVLAALVGMAWVATEFEVDDDEDEL